MRHVAVPITIAKYVTILRLILVGSGIASPVAIANLVLGKGSPPRQYDAHKKSHHASRADDDASPRNRVKTVRIQSHRAYPVFSGIALFKLLLFIAATRRGP